MLADKRLIMAPMLKDFLERSSATPAFRAAVEEFARTGRPSETLRFDGRSPAVKVERTLTKLLEEHSDVAIEAVELSAHSGCSNYTGSATIRSGDGDLRVSFDWDCQWKAQQMGWTDYFGFADQTRAAREFGYDCFRVWEPESDAVVPATSEAQGS